MAEQAVRERTEGCWASLILRLAVAALFFAAAVGKWMKGGPSVTADGFVETFAGTWLPAPMVRVHGLLTPIIESVIPVWLVLGVKLKAGWIFTGLFLVTLAFGMSVAGKHDIAAANYNYVLIACIGLYLSQYDRINLDRCLGRK